MDHEGDSLKVLLFTALADIDTFQVAGYFRLFVIVRRKFLSCAVYIQKYVLSTEY